MSKVPRIRSATRPVMSAEEAVAAIFSLDDAPLTCSEVPAFIEELAKRGYRLIEIAAKESWT